MAGSFKDTMEHVGDKISETATKVGHTVSEKVEEASDWAKEKSHQAEHKMAEMGQKADHKAKQAFGETGPAGTLADITEHMDVLASCGTKVGRVDHVQGSSIKLTRSDSPDGMHHLIPTSWVSRVDSHVHLSKDHKEVQRDWQPA